MTLVKDIDIGKKNAKSNACIFILNFSHWQDKHLKKYLKAYGY